MTSDNDSKPKYKFQKGKHTYHWPIRASSICVGGGSKTLKTFGRDSLIKETVKLLIKYFKLTIISRYLISV